MFWDSQSSSCVYQSLRNGHAWSYVFCSKRSAIEQGNVHVPPYFLLHTCTNKCLRCWYYHRQSWVMFFDQFDGRLSFTLVTLYHAWICVLWAKGTCSLPLPPSFFSLPPPPLAPLLLPLLPPHPTVLCISDFVVTHGVFFDLRNLSGDESSFPEIPRQERQISESSQKNVSMNNWLNFLGSSMVIFGDKNAIQGHR